MKAARHTGKPVLIAVFCWAFLSIQSQAETLTIPEASGITRAGNTLLVVDDSQPGRYFQFRLSGRPPSLIPLQSAQLQPVVLRHGGQATDLEAIDVLADGRIAVLSEEHRALYSDGGMIVEYDVPFSMFARRGLEGLAVRRLPGGVSHIAVVWEGGYPDRTRLSDSERSRLGPEALQPLLQTHVVDPANGTLQLRGVEYVALDVSKPRGHSPQAQRFRVPDLVWHRFRDGSWGFVALLSSQSGEPKPTYGYHWLQRFSLLGKRIGKPIDIDALVPENLRGVNWEGLGWFEEGESLLLVHESKPKPIPVAFILELPEHWKSERPPAYELTHTVRKESDFFLNHPDSSRPPDGTLAAGTEVEVLSRSRGYALLCTEDHRLVYVRSGRLLRKGSDPTLASIRRPFIRGKNEILNFGSYLAEGIGSALSRMADGFSTAFLPQPKHAAQPQDKQAAP